MKAGDNVVAYVDQILGPVPTVRHVKCEILVQCATVRCRACVKYRSTLRTMHSRSNADPSTTVASSSKKNERWMSEDELRAKISTLKEEKRETEKELKQTKRKLEKLEEILENEGINVSEIGIAITCDNNILLMQVDSDSNNDLLSIMRRNSSSVLAKYPEGSFPWVFWKQQLEAAELKDCRSMRWHPFMIRSTQCLT